MVALLGFGQTTEVPCWLEEIKLLNVHRSARPELKENIFRFPQRGVKSFDSRDPQARLAAWRPDSGFMQVSQVAALSLCRTYYPLVDATFVLK